TRWAFSRALATAAPGAVMVATGVVGTAGGWLTVGSVVDTGAVVWWTFMRACRRAVAASLSADPVRAEFRSVTMSCWSGAITVLITLFVDPSSYRDRPNCVPR